MNVLLIPGRCMNQPDWDKAVAGVRRIALQAADAAGKHDNRAFRVAGSALDAACDVCHARYDPRFNEANRQAP